MVVESYDWIEIFFTELLIYDILRRKVIDIYDVYIIHKIYTQGTHKVYKMCVSCIWDL